MQSRVRSALGCALCCVALMIGSTAAGAATFFGYPAPGGNSFSSTGSVGSLGGREFNYSNFDNSAYTELYWGWDDVQMGTSSAAGGSGLVAMTRTGAFGGAIMTWHTAANAVKINTTSGLQELTGRFTAQLSTGTWMDPAAAAGGGISGGPLAVTQVTGDFTVYGFFHVLVGSNWMPFFDYFNSQSTVTNCGTSTAPAGCTLTNLNGEFWYTAPLAEAPEAVPVPAALPLFGSVLGGAGLFGWLRRRRAARPAA